MTIGDYLDAARVVFLEQADRAAATRVLIGHAADQGLLADRNGFERAISERETILSTAVGQGVAVPHAKLDGIAEFFVVVGISSTPIEWDAPDRTPVHLVFLIGGPATQQTRYLQILAKIMLVVKNDDLRARIRGASSGEDVVATFSGI